MGVLRDKVVGKKSDKLLRVKRGIGKKLKVFLSEEQCSRLNTFFYRINQFLDPEVREYIKNKAVLRYYNQPEENKAKVIILGLRTFSTHNLMVFEKVLSDFLRNNGASVKILICDNILESCDAEVIDGVSQDVVCYQCKKERKQYKKLYRNDYLSFSQFISPEEIEDARNLVSSLADKDLINFTYLGVNISRHAIDSTIKYFRKGNFNPGDPSHLKILRHNTLQGVISLKVAKNLVEEENPTHLVSLHGCYVSWGPFCDYCRNKNMHVVIYGKALHKIGHFGFSTLERGRGHDILWDTFRNKDLSMSQKEDLRNFFNKRKEGKTLDYKLYHAGKKAYGSDTIIQKILSSDNRKKYVLYPNLLWDIGLELSGSNIFRDIYDWMFQTIKYFAQLKDCFLLVKPHPGEASIDYTEHGVNEVITDYFGTLPENIILIPKDYPVTCFDLMEKDCIGITYNGEVGMEYSYFKKPILVGGNIHYVNNKMAIKVTSGEEYFNLIKDPKPLYDYPRQNYDLIERYAYFCYFRSTLPIPFFRKDVWLGHCIDWRKLSNYEDFIKNDRTMNYIADSIIKKQVIVCPDDDLANE